MKKGLVVVGLVIMMMVSLISPAFAASPAVHNVTIIVNSPYVADAQVYVAGDFNGWNATATPLSPYGYSYSGYSGQWTVTIPMTQGKHQFKFSLGTTNTFEKGNSFEEISNRVIDVGTNDMNTTQTVANYNGVVNLEVSVPSDTLTKGYRVFVASSNKAWSATSYMMFPKDGSNNVWYTKALVKSGTTIQYKYTVGTWSSVEKTLSGKDVANRNASLSIVKKDTVAKWN